MAPTETPTSGSNVETKTKFSENMEQVSATHPPPPEHTYPCGCSYPGLHAPDCMWSLWEQMRDNYNQTKTLMGKFMSQVDGIQSQASCQCKCPPSCHGHDLAQAVGLQQLTGVTVPFGVPRSLTEGEVSRLTMAPGYPVMSEALRQMEEQSRIKNTWAQFLNIFDMSLDLANDVSKDRQDAKMRRKERAKLEQEQRKEEARRERQERCCAAKERAADTAAQKQYEKEGDKNENKKNLKEKKSDEKPKEKEKPKPKQEIEPEPESEPDPEPEPESEVKAEPQPNDLTPTDDQDKPTPSADEGQNPDVEAA